MNDLEQDFIRPIFVNGTNHRDNDILYMVIEFGLLIRLEKLNKMRSQKNDSGYWRQHAIRKTLEKTFDSSSERVLLFHDYLTKEMLNETLYQRPNIYQNLLMSGNIQKFDWPCMPRRKAIAVTEISHVLKNYSYYSGK